MSISPVYSEVKTGIGAGRWLHPLSLGCGLSIRFQPQDPIRREKSNNAGAKRPAAEAHEDLKHLKIQGGSASGTAVGQAAARRDRGPQYWPRHGVSSGFAFGDPEHPSPGDASKDSLRSRRFAAASSDHAERPRTASMRSQPSGTGALTLKERPASPRSSARHMPHCTRKPLSHHERRSPISRRTLRQLQARTQNAHLRRRLKTSFPCSGCDSAPRAAAWSTACSTVPGVHLCRHARAQYRPLHRGMIIC